MSVVIHHGDCRDVLLDLPDESVHCVVTSPPYFGLRDYGSATWEGGGPMCDHVAPPGGGRNASGLNSRGGQAHLDWVAKLDKQTQFRSVCGKCGATRVDRQIGLEPTPDAYVAEMVAVFREVRRVLRKDGTCWLNLGDSYSGGKMGRADTGDDDLARRAATYGTGTGAATGPREFKQRPVPSGLKPKDLIGIPWRVAFALQADGWYLRQDIIWAKPNPMPESVRDRCTKAHEYVFLLSKSPRYFYDAEAVSEPVTQSTIARLSQPNLENQIGSDRVPGKTNGAMKAKPPRFGGSKSGLSEEHHHRTKSGNEYDFGNGRRNRRSVWTIATQPYAEAHFATFPPELPELCIKAGCPPCGTVLDPFAGAGTTGLVADRLGRDAILIELNPDYGGLAHTRIVNDAPLFAAVATV